MTSLKYQKQSIQFLFRPRRTNSNFNLQNQEGNIYARLISIDQNPVEINTKIKCYRKQWSPSKSKLKSMDEISQLKNEELQRFETRIRTVSNDLYKRNDTVSLKELKEVFTGSKSKRNNLIELFERMVLETKNSMAKSTYSHYRTTFNYLKEFISESFKTNELPIERVDYVFLENLDSWIRRNKSCGDSGVSKHHIRFSKFLTIQKKRGFIVANPYDQFNIPRHEARMDFLDEEELAKIENLDLSNNKKLSRVRDAFVFSCYSGLSYIDLKRLTRDVILDHNGQLIIKAKRQKTDIDFTVVLLPKAVEILFDYQSSPEVLTVNCLVPVYSNQKMNDYLKEIQRLCGIEKRITFHMSRHTFGTMYLLKGGRLEALKGIMGHSDIKTTQIYGKITDDLILRDMSNVMQTLNSNS